MCHASFRNWGASFLYSNISFKRPLTLTWAINRGLQSISLDLLYFLERFCGGTNYHITGIIRGRKVSRISQIWKHSRMFFCIFYLGRNLYIWNCLNRENFLVNYGQEGKSRNFSSADDSRYTVIMKFVAILYRCWFSYIFLLIITCWHNKTDV